MMASLSNFNHTIEGTDFMFAHNALKQERVKEAFTRIIGKPAEKKEVKRAANWIEQLQLGNNEEEIIRSLFTHLYALEQENDTMKEKLFELEEKTTVYKEKAYFCGLTKSLNRNFFLDFVDLFEQRRKKLQNQLSTYFFFLDLVKFKEINDTYGHSVGDEILIEFSQRLTRVMRSEDTESFDIEKLITKNFVARIGGDEFVGKIELSSDEDAEKLKKRIEDSMKTPFTTNVGLLHVGASVGYQQIKEDLNTKDVLKEADRKMYEEKRK